MVGRKAMSNVIWCDSDKKAIGNAIDKATDKEFYNNNIKGIENIYGDGYASERALNLIKFLDIKSFDAFRIEDPLDIRKKLVKKKNE